MKNRLRKMSLVFAAVAFFAAWAADAFPAGEPASAAPAYLYKTTFVRAAPGRLLDLIALYKSWMAVEEAAGDERPFWWRHTQGDQWDLMLLYPMGSYGEYYVGKRISRRAKAAGAAPISAAEFKRRLDACSAWREDVFVYGPPVETVKKAFEGTGYYHIEICVALPGKQEELYKERQMENAYQMALGRPEYMIFVRDQGANWDLYTLACFRDLAHWASSGDASKDKRAAAARAAGFSDPDAIGPYLRTLIQMHRDTMGVAIK
jgi:hypothetical protein